MTKWDVLQSRLDDLEDEARRLQKEMEGLQNTRCNLTCSGCGLLLETEADFAKHFVISDVRFLNLGECPDKI